MTSDLQQTRYDQIIRRVGGIIGPGSKVSEALSELFPVIDIENVPGELLLLGQTNLCFGGVQNQGAAGEGPRIQLFNPAESGKLISVSTVYVSSLEIQVIRYTVGTIPLTNGVGTERFRDTRLGGTSSPAGQIRSDSTVALTDATSQFRIRANDADVITDPNTVAVLFPGSGLEFGGGTFNSTITVSFNWRERLALESELNIPGG